MKACAAGKCADTCADTQTVCGGSCVDTQTDRANCGGCGSACASGEICTAGQCALSCQQGLTLCAAPVSDGGVSDASSDASNDGAADASSDGGALGLPACVDLQTDNANCGACGVVCGPATACIGGACVAGCAQSQTFCTPDGGAPYCANTDSDNANCGACGTTCTSGATCAAGKCTFFVTHNDGLGEHWGDLVPFGTHDITQATAACQAYIAAHPNDTCDAVSGCSCGGQHECVYNTAGGNGQTRRTWFFAGTLVGTVTNNSCTPSNIPWD